MKVSVILACYNGEGWIAEAIESVLNQIYGNIELLIIDDGSSDDSREIVKQYESDKRIRYIFQQNRGFSAANNTGIRHAKGALVAFIGQDDIWLKNKLKEQIRCLKEDQRVGIVHSDLYHINEEGDIVKRRRPHIPDTETRRELIEYLFFHNFICFQTALVRRDCFKNGNLFDERMAAFSDHDLWLRIAGNTDLEFVNKPLVKKRYHKNQLSRLGRAAAIRDEFLMVDKAIKIYPFLNRLKEKKWGNLYYDWGLFLLINDNNEGAKEQFVKAMKCHWWDWRYQVAALIPGIYLSTLKKYIRLRRAVSTEPSIECSQEK